jgi:hypothetical protein
MLAARFEFGNYALGERPVGIFLGRMSMLRQKRLGYSCRIDLHAPIRVALTRRPALGPSGHEDRWIRRQSR